MELIDAIKIVLEYINDGEELLENVDYSKKQFQKVDSAIQELQNYVLVEDQPEFIPDDGYADGGEPYTQEELDIINKKG